MARAGGAGVLAPASGAGYHVGGGPSTMLAAVLREAGRPMEVERLRMPRPKAGEVLLKTRACGVCHTDLHVIKSEQPFPMPCVLGHEVSGEVVELGPGTDPGTARRRVGHLTTTKRASCPSHNEQLYCQYVWLEGRLPLGSRAVGAFIMPCGGCFFCTKGNEDLCETFFAYNRGKGTLYDGETRLFLADSGAPISMYSMGGLAEYCVVPATAVAALPQSLPYAESAVLGCAFFTAYGAMRNAADMRAGDSIAVIGAGGVGSSCLQMARAFGGHTIIAVDIDGAKLEKAKGLGASHVINAMEEDVVQRIKEITGGLGVDIAVEALGRKNTFMQAVAAVRDGGKAVMVGIAPVGVTAEVEIARIVRRKIQIVGSYGARARSDLPVLLGLVESGLLDVAAAVSQARRLEEAAETYQALDQGQILGRAIVDFGE
eukprot:SM000175S03277  [mRNA]  locus=s175:53706:56333:+ [translate_table: standard]